MSAPNSNIRYIAVPRFELSLCTCKLDDNKKKLVNHSLRESTCDFGLFLFLSLSTISCVNKEYLSFGGGGTKPLVLTAVKHVDTN